MADFGGMCHFKWHIPVASNMGYVQYMHGNILVVPVDRYLCALSPNDPLPDINWRR